MKCAAGRPKDRIELKILGALPRGDRPSRRLRPSVPVLPCIASYERSRDRHAARLAKIATARAGPARPTREPTAEAIRLELADAWGDMGAAWGVAPAIARVQAYLMARQEPLTEREVREALGLSHRATSLALAEAESWGIVERVPEPRRVGDADRPAPPISRSAITGNGSGGSSPSARSAKATLSSPCSRRRNARPRPRSRRTPTTWSWRRCATGFGVPRLRAPVRSGRRARPAARAARTGTLAPAPRPRPRRHDPAAVRPARRPARPGRHRPRRRSVATLADGGRRATKLMSGVVRTVSR